MTELEKVIEGEKKAIDWDTLTEKQKRKAKRELRKLVGVKWDKLQRELKKVLNAMEIEITHKGVASTDNIQRRDLIYKEMIKLSREIK